VTSTVIVHGATVKEHVDVHELTMRALTPAQIAEYVARDQPLDCAGSYKSESLGVALFERICGEDATAVVGLPLAAVTRILASFGADPLG
jgi:predicted house-cleaning NTP pyrophosphatase (Maf/HAM1 superfamily)